MRRALSGVTVGLIAAGLAVLSPAGSAAADPKSGETFQVECENGATYSVITPPAEGSFTPGFDVNSNTVLIPVVFDGFEGTVFDENGDEVASFTDPTVEVKGSGKQRNLTRCTATFEGTFTLTAEEAEEEGLPGPARTRSSAAAMSSHRSGAARTEHAQRPALGVLRPGRGAVASASALSEGGCTVRRREGRADRADPCATCSPTSRPASTCQFGRPCAACSSTTWSSAGAATGYT